jgi:L-rhamnose isomerase
VWRWLLCGRNSLNYRHYANRKTEDRTRTYHALLPEHRRKLEYITAGLPDAEEVLRKLIDFQVAIPSWALGTGGTRFGRFSGGGEPRSLEEKIEDIGLLHALNRSSGAISLHIPWDIPTDAAAMKALAAQFGLRFRRDELQYLSGPARAALQL